MTISTMLKNIAGSTLILVLVMTGMESGLAQSPGMPGQTPEVLTGVIDSIDPASRTVVIDDRQYVLPSSLKGVSLLQPGVEIKFRYYMQGDVKVITEVFK